MLQPRNTSPLPWLTGLLLLAACGPTGGSNDNQPPPRDGGQDAAPRDAAGPDAAPWDGTLPADAAPPDAAQNLVWDAAGVTHWQVKAVNSLLLTDPARLATHPSAPTTLAAMPAATPANPNMVVFRSVDGLTFTPATVVSFSGGAGFFGTPRGLAYDPRSGDVLVAALQPVPPPNTELALVLAWSENGGASFTYPWTPWAAPWPPEEMRFADGSPSELVWRSGASFFFSADHGVTFPRSETLSPLPAGCAAITGFDVPRNDHDAAAIWCDSGDGFLCDLPTGACTDLAVTGPVVDAHFSSANPLVLWLLTADRVWRSQDAGFTFAPVHGFAASRIRADPANGARACALQASTGALRCTRDGGATWMDLTPPDLQAPPATTILDFAYAADGRIWALAHPGVVTHPAP